MKLPAYPRTKPSGIEWLGDIPEHWDTTRFRFLVRSSNAGEVIDRSYWHSGEEILFSCQRESMASDFPDFPLRKRTTENDLLVTRNGTPYVHVPPANAIYSNVVQRCILKQNLLRGFIALALETACESLRGEGYGVSIPSFSYEKWCDLPLPLPSPSEQCAIAVFLDRETGRIDRLVAKKRELIERLQEKRTALIGRTVTSGLPAEAAAKAGLNPTAKLKPSGIEWLGDVPEHWEAVTVRRRARRIQTGGTPPTAEERYYEDGTVPWYGPGSFDDQITVSQPVKLLHHSAVTEGAARVFAAGATMIVTIGATLGKVSSLPEVGSCNQQITVIEFDERRVHPRFATYQLKRLEPAMRAVAPCATLPILDQGEIADIGLALPPLPEQRAITDHLDRETAILDALAAKMTEAIERLQEYRTALITAAVTGKIDVRKEVA